MPQPMKADVPSGPVEIAVFRPDAVMFDAQFVPHAVQETRRLRRNMIRLGGDEQHEDPNMNWFNIQYIGQEFYVKGRGTSRPISSTVS